MTQVSFDFAASFVLDMGSVGSTSVDVDQLAKHPNVLAYVFAYGLKQIVNDSHASITAKVEADDKKRIEQKRALAEKKIASLIAGEIAQARTSTGGNPTERLAFELAETELREAIRKSGKKLSAYKPAELTAAAKRHLEKHNARFTEAATKILAIKPETTTDAINLDDLFVAQTE